MSGEPIILYENVCEASATTITATDTASGYSTTSLKNRLTWDRWRSNGSATETIDIDLGASGATACTGLALSGHNLRTITCSGVTVYQSSDGITYTAVGALSPSWGTSDKNDRTWMFHWGSTGSGYTVAANRYWRATFTGLDSNLEIGVFALGRMLVLPEYMGAGFDPDAITVKSREARARGGNFLGATVEMVDQSMKLDFGPAGLATSFFTTTGTPSWDDFLRTSWSLGKPFFFRPSGGYAGSVGAHGNGYYCTPGDKAKSSAPYVSALRRDWKFGFDVIPEGYMGT